MRGASVRVPVCVLALAMLASALAVPTLRVLVHYPHVRPRLAPCARHADRPGRGPHSSRRSMRPLVGVGREALALRPAHGLRGARDGQLHGRVRCTAPTTPTLTRNA